MPENKSLESILNTTKWGNVTALDLSTIVLKDATEYQLLKEKLQQATRLRRITLPKCIKGKENECAVQLSEIISLAASHSTLDHLDMSSALIKSSETLEPAVYEKLIDSLSMLLEKNKQLKQLILTHWGLDASALQKIDSALINHPNLSVLGLTYNNIGDLGAKQIATVIEKNQTLKNVALMATDIGPIGLSALSKILRHRKNIYVSLAQNPDCFSEENEEGVKEYCKDIAENPTINTLSLHFNKIPLANVPHFVDLMLARPDISYHLGHNSFAPDAMKRMIANLCIGLSNNTTTPVMLTSLDLRSAVDDDDIELLSLALLSNNRLRELNIRDSKQVTEASRERLNTLAIVNPYCDVFLEGTSISPNTINELNQSRTKYKAFPFSKIRSEYNVQVDFEDRFKNKLLNAVIKNDLKKVENALNYGVNVNTVFNKDDYSVLHIAARKNNIKILEQLIKNDADLDIKSKNTGATPLMSAAASGAKDAVNYLVIQGADRKVTANFGLNAAQCANKNKHDDIARWLNNTKEISIDKVKFDIISDNIDIDKCSKWHVICKDENDTGMTYGPILREDFHPDFFKELTHFQDPEFVLHNTILRTVSDAATRDTYDLIRDKLNQQMQLTPNDVDIITLTKAILSGAKSGLNDLFHMITHPLDDMLYPMLDFIYDATIIAAGYLLEKSNMTDLVDPLANDILLLEDAIAKNPQIYSDACNRMQQRMDAFQHFKTIFTYATPEKKVEMMTEVATTVLVPGWIPKAVKAINNLHKFNMINPPKFHNTISHNTLNPPPPIKNLSISDIRNAKGKKDYLYVITKDEELFIAPRHYPESLMRPKANGEGMVVSNIIFHPELARLKPVFAAGHVEAENGFISLIPSKTGHFLTDQRVSSNFVESTFVKNGFTEARGKYRYHEPHNNTAGNAKKPIVNYDDLHIPSLYGSLVGIYPVLENELSKAELISSPPVTTVGPPIQTSSFYVPPPVQTFQNPHAEAMSRFEEYDRQRRESENQLWQSIERNRREQEIRQQQEYARQQREREEQYRRTIDSARDMYQPAINLVSQEMRRSNTSISPYGFFNNSGLQCLSYSSLTPMVGQVRPGDPLRQGYVYGLYCKPSGTYSGYTRYTGDYNSWLSGYKSFNK